MRRQWTLMSSSDFWPPSKKKECGTPFFGGVALNLHGLGRFTEGLDIFVEPEADNIHRLRVALRAVIEDPEIENITAEDLLGEYPAVQYIPPDGSFHVDILTRLDETFSFSGLETERVAFDDIT